MLPDEDDKKACYEYEQLQFSIRVLLDALAMLFDGGRGSEESTASTRSTRRRRDTLWRTRT